MTHPIAIGLLELNNRITTAINAAGLSNTWVVAETSDVRQSNGHCYMELIEKDPNTGSIRARARATIWASQFLKLNAVFRNATGSPITSDIKIMVRASVSYHPVFGLSLNINDINPEFTLGDLLRRRREMIARLKADGIIDQNRSLSWQEVPQRIAIISAQNAAGYGDFINQLYTNRYCLRFESKLFHAIVQGEHAAESIISALQQIAEEDCYDCVVLIRGGGATGDLAAFDNYDLAASIAMFPIPVVIGIGHERDVTLLDYVANTRVKTPTAAAELLISFGVEALSRLQRIATDILDRSTACLNSQHRRLENAMARIPLLTSNIIARQSDRLKSFESLLTALSPEATLRRGFSITRINGNAITSASALSLGDMITTTLSDGQIQSTVTEK